MTIRIRSNYYLTLAKAIPLWILVIALLCGRIPVEAATANFWLAETEQNRGPDAPTIEVLAGSVNEVEIWGRPEAGFNLQAFALNLIAEQSGAITFLNVEVLNPFYSDSNPANPIKRHQLVFDSSQSVGPARIELRPDRIVGFSGLTFFNDAANLFPGGGIGPTCEDALCEQDTSGQPMWKIGTARFRAGAVGTSTPLFLELGTQGIWHTGENPTDTSVRFGEPSDVLHEWAAGMDPATDADHRDMHMGLPDALIEVVSQLSNADFNDDSDVDGADFLTWQRGLGVAKTHVHGDANFDGVVNDQDLSLWQMQYGTAGTASLSSIPEPTAFVLLAVATIAACIKPSRGKRSHRPSTTLAA